MKLEFRKEQLKQLYINNNLHYITNDGVWVISYRKDCLYNGWHQQSKVDFEKEFGIKVDDFEREDVKFFPLEFQDEITDDKVVIKNGLIVELDNRLNNLKTKADFTLKVWAEDEWQFLIDE